MSETPIIRLAAFMYAKEECKLDAKDPMFKSELEHFYQQHRLPNTKSWTAYYIRMAAEAHAYMKDEGRE